MIQISQILSRTSDVHLSFSRKCSLKITKFCVAKSSFLKKMLATFCRWTQDSKKEKNTRSRKQAEIKWHFCPLFKVKYFISTNADSSKPLSRTSDRSTLPGGEQTADSEDTSSCVPDFLSVGWSLLQKAKTTCPEFTIQSMLVLFLESWAEDGEACANFKALVGNNKPNQLFKAGYVSNI